MPHRPVAASGAGDARRAALVAGPPGDGSALRWADRARVRAVAGAALAAAHTRVAARDAPGWSASAWGHQR